MRRTCFTAAVAFAFLVAPPATPARAADPGTFSPPPDEAPPSPPRRKGVVAESSLGALGFGGQFRRTAPPGVWLHTQVGYELTRWLMIFGEGELAVTDTSIQEGPSRVRAFPLFGFGGGARVTVHITERVAAYVQGSAGLMKADVPANALAVLGYRRAELLGLTAGGRLGLEWYQTNRHLALGVAGGTRYAAGFAKDGSSNDLPLVWDAAATLRYTF